MKRKGEGMVEYGLIIGLIAVIVIAVVLALGPQIKVLFKGPEAIKELPGTPTTQAEVATETTNENKETETE
ncbi:MAG: Flp family type IVb pilin [bacterium]|nr:Flp family type IVb pilin [bacterium]